jgi:outer membrane immunogenic protein
MKKLLLNGAAVFVLSGAPAFAADMPVKAARPATVAVYDWSGIYIGGGAGWQGSRIDLSDPVFGTITYSPRHSSFALGAFAGVQRQFGQFVLGVEGGYMSAFGDVSLGATGWASIFLPGGIGNAGTAQTKLRNIWSAGGRVGWAMGRWLPYVTGGYANGSFELDGQSTPPTAPGSEQTKASTGGGYIGGGIDWALTKNWIIGAEYRHYAFSAKTVTSTGVGNHATEQVRFAPSTDTVLARLSYKFDWAPLR